jgi:hypothetical protein
MTTQLEAVEGLVRIRVPIERSRDDPGPEADWLWAEPLGSDRFRVESCPFFAYGISRDDVVLAVEPRGGDAPRLEDVMEKGGHRTLRMALDPAAELSHRPVQELLEALLELGCTHEALRPKIVAIDLPPQVDVAVVTGLLQARVRDGLILWEWADPRPS